MNIRKRTLHRSHVVHLLPFVLFLCHFGGHSSAFCKGQTRETSVLLEVLPETDDNIARVHLGNIGQECSEAVIQCSGVDPRAKRRMSNLCQPPQPPLSGNGQQKMNRASLRGSPRNSHLSSSILVAKLIPSKDKLSQVDFDYNSRSRTAKSRMQIPYEVQPTMKSSLLPVLGLSPCHALLEELSVPSTADERIGTLLKSDSYHKLCMGKTPAASHISRRAALQRQPERRFRKTVRILYEADITSGGSFGHRGKYSKLFEGSTQTISTGGGNMSTVSEHERWKSPLRESGNLIIINVSQDGTGDFHSIQDAVDSVPARNTQRIIIRIHAGTYREKVVVPYNKPFITFHGDEDNQTPITWNNTASTKYTTKYFRTNASLFGTMQSSSVTILSDGFVAQYMQFENSAPAPQPGAVGAQAVAFLIGGDRAAFYYCSFLGAQDTLYDYVGRHYYMNCFIQGSIDFIFGNGRSLFEKCVLHSIATSIGAIAAHQRLSPEDETGFSFHRCVVTGSGMLYLGRAWSPFARIVYARTYFDNIIFAEGWSDFGDPERRRTTFFGQYDCVGPGANVSHRATWSKQLTDEDVLPYLSLDFVNGKEWVDVPFI